MTDQRNLLDAAYHAGDVLADQLIVKNNELRALRRALRRAYTQLNIGRADDARRILQQALSEHKP